MSSKSELLLARCVSSFGVFQIIVNACCSYPTLLRAFFQALKADPQNQGCVGPRDKSLLFWFSVGVFHRASVDPKRAE